MKVILQVFILLLISCLAQCQSGTNQNDEIGEYTSSFQIAESAMECKIVDAENDGDFDLIIFHPTNGNKLWINDGNRSFKSEEIIFGTFNVFQSASADLDNDSNFEIILGQMEGTKGNSIYFNKSENHN